MLFSNSSAANTVGLHIGTDAMALASVTTGKADQPKSRQCSSLRIEDFSLANSSSIGDQLGQVVKKHRLSGAACVAVLEPDMYELFMLPAPPVAEDEMLQALKWRVKDLVDYPLEEAVIDVFPIPVEKHREARVYLVVARNENIRTVVNIVEQSGLELTAIEIAELALGNLVEKIDGSAQGIGLIHFGEKDSRVNVYHNSALFLSRQIDIGLNEMRQVVADDPETIFENITLELQRTMDFFESEFAKPPIGNIYLSPRHPVLQSLCDYLGDHMGVKVQLMNVDHLFPGEDMMEDEDQVNCLLALGGASRK